MSTEHRDPRLDALLEELGPAEPPAGFAAGVMDKVSQTRIGDTHDTLHATSKIIPFSNGGFAMTVTKKAMWGLATAAAVILAVFVARGGFPTVDRTEGAIGAAKKYQAPQIAANDVTTGDASVQEFLQSDEFDRVLKDPDALAALKGSDLRSALRERGFADAIRQSDVRRELRGGLYHKIFEDAAARAALNDALRMNARAAVRNASMEASMRGVKSAEARAALTRALDDANLRKALDNEGFRKVMDDAGMRSMLARNNVRAALSSDAFARALARQNFDAAVRSSAFEAAILQR